MIIKVLGGKIPDGRNIMSRARYESSEYEKTYAIPITGNVI